VLGELTPLKLTFNLPPAATVEELAVKVATVIIGVGVAIGVGVGVTVPPITLKQELLAAT
jgi:hypothetical protein